MAEFIITIPSTKVTALIDAFATLYNYQEQIDVDGATVTNPETKTQFAKRQVNEFIKNVYIAGQVSQIEATRATMVSTATADISTVTTV